MCWLHLKQRQWLPPHSQSRWLILFKCTAITPALRKRLGGGGHCTAESGLKKQKDSSCGSYPILFSFRHLETDPDSSSMHFYTEQYDYISNDSNNHTFTNEKKPESWRLYLHFNRFTETDCSLEWLWLLPMSCWSQWRSAKTNLGGPWFTSEDTFHTRTDVQYPVQCRGHKGAPLEVHPLMMEITSHGPDRTLVHSQMRKVSFQFKMSHYMDMWIGGASVIMQKRGGKEGSSTYDHKRWVVTEGMRDESSQKMRFFCPG